ncbi:MAG: YihY/virulence factor BrkB family protein [Salegentibacter sp.]|uniref:YihY/virulence factor BrkB family protein n=1 Tax=Salegentibacter sp. TaxID=1903072 RepID=UPI00287026CC|nr:YihY/virulence factor BrkB family protein [Salegentibacter sp.]MDR9457850.1 YihY/virulence factor BrkB family protein [Salegentibacter sp.]
MEKNEETKSLFEIKVSGWKIILLRVKDQIAEDNVGIVSAGVAFYAFLAIFPALMALISIYGLAMNPENVQSQISYLSNMMPEQAFSIVEAQINEFTSTSGKALSWGTTLGIIFSLWSANKGTKSLFTGVDIAYNTNNTRNFIRQNALTLLFTFGAVLILILSMVLIVIFPALVDQLGLPERIESLITWLRWVILALLVVFFLGIVYKYAPVRPNPSFQMVFPGSLVATLIWLAASWGFSYYVSNFGSYGEVYGSISAVVILMLWLLLTSWMVLLGAELNSEIECYAKNSGRSTTKVVEE